MTKGHSFRGRKELSLQNLSQLSPEPALKPQHLSRPVRWDPYLLGKPVCSGFPALSSKGMESLTSFTPASPLGASLHSHEHGPRAGAKGRMINMSGRKTLKLRKHRLNVFPRIWEGMAPLPFALQPGEPQCSQAVVFPPSIHSLGSSTTAGVPEMGFIFTPVK